MTQDYADKIIRAGLRDFAKEMRRNNITITECLEAFAWYRDQIKKG